MTYWSVRLSRSESSPLGVVVLRISSARAGSSGAGSAGITGEDEVDSPSSAVELLEKGEEDLEGA